MSTPSPHQEQHGRWERRDVDVVGLFLIAAILVIGGIFAVLLTGGMLRFLNHQRNVSDKAPPAVAAERADFPLPRLQISPPVDLEKFGAEQNRELTTYGWIDRQKGIVRIPIERAIELLSQRGLPQTNQRVTPLQLQQQRPQERSENERR